MAANWNPLTTGGVAIQIYPDPKQFAAIEELTRSFPAEARAAIARAVNRGADAARVQISREIARATTLKYAAVKSRIKLTRAKPATLTAILELRGKGLPLTYLRARQSKLTVQEPKRIFANYKGRVGWFTVRRRGSGITYRVFGNIERVPRGFLGRARFGNMAAFERKVGGTDLKFLRGPSVVDIAAHTPGLLQKLRVDVTDVVTKRINSQIEWLWSKYGTPPAEGGTNG